MMRHNIIIYSCYPIVRVALEMIIKKYIIHSNVTVIDGIEQFEEIKLEEKFELLLIDPKNETDLHLIYSLLNGIKKEQKIVVLTDNNLPKKNKNALNITFIDKSSNERKIITCLQGLLDVKKNYKILTTTIKKQNTLSKRETECAVLLMKGYSVNQISKKLTLALTTVSTYRARIFKKTRTNNLVELTKSLYDLENAL